MASLTFLGAARTVTGSKYLLEVDGYRLLIDCGLFQGLKDLRLRNWAAWPIHPAGIHAVVLTHAHLDHSGMLPRLVAGGFRGRIHSTRGTKDLCQLVLPDAGHIQEEDARRANQGRYSKHMPALPLFTEADAGHTLTLFDSHAFNRPVEVAPGIEAEFINAGHLLGSSYVRVRRKDGTGGTLLFGGDLGRYNRPVLPDPSPGVACDVLLVESTYGDRLHPADDDGAALAEIVHETFAKKGKLVIPAFAIGRVEEVIYALKTLEDADRIPKLPVYVDSPMALGALEYYRRHQGELDDDVGPGRAACCAFATAKFRPVATAQESEHVVESAGPSIIISASGMATGGRVLHHLHACLPDPKSTILFVGFQAAGTRGRLLIEGAHYVKMFGQQVPVRARIAKLNGMSAHADQGEILRWLRTFPAPPRTAYLVHGEPPAQAALETKIQQELGWTLEVPSQNQQVEVPL
jgi:metallo-beta-lactamase family protein